MLFEEWFEQHVKSGAFDQLGYEIEAHLKILWDFKEQEKKESECQQD